MEGPHRRGDSAVAVIPAQKAPLRRPGSDSSHRGGWRREVRALGGKGKVTSMRGEKIHRSAAFKGEPARRWGPETCGDGTLVWRGTRLT
jgi:hypothetical protein